MKLTFWGADKTVTGSMHHVETGGRQYLLDCGLYQGHRQEAFARNSQFPFPASAIDAVILSHAHIDHSGNLPGLVKHGFQGPIYATPATVDLCDVLLKDTAHIQEKDAEFLNKHRKPNAKGGHEPIQPLFTMADVSGRRVRAEVDENDIANVHIGQKLLITADAYSHRTFSGVVTQLANVMGRKSVVTGDPAQKADRDILEVTADLSQPANALPIGLRVTVQFIR